jgi:hypothetical protein
VLQPTNIIPGCNQDTSPALNSWKIDKVVYKVLSQGIPDDSRIEAGEFSLLKTNMVRLERRNNLSYILSFSWVIKPPNIPRQDFVVLNCIIHGTHKRTTKASLHEGKSGPKNI